MSSELTEDVRGFVYDWLPSTPIVRRAAVEELQRIWSARETALRAQIAAEIRAEREGFLSALGLNPVWIAGWHAATDHIAARIAEGGTDE